jgi:uncharacterized coiled-coil protein SlyX
MNELLTINDRIKYAIEHEGHTIATFARKCGVPDGTIRNMFARGNKPGYDLTVAIINAINQPWCDANWLVMGQETKSAVEDQDTKKLLKLIADLQKTNADQQRTIEEQRKRIDTLTDRLLAAEGK